MTDKSRVLVWLKRAALVSGGAVGVACVRYRNGLESATPLEVRVYSTNGHRLRAFSRFWGRVAQVQLPAPFESALVSAYVRATGVDLAEAEPDTVQGYRTLAELFTRRLKAGARLVDRHGELVSPADGVVMTADNHCREKLPQIKGTTYDMKTFLGIQAQPESLLKYPKNNVLHQMVIYLAPRDYHRFHSPCSWRVKTRKHFSGKLLSVSPSVASVVPDLFCDNERVVYTGEWKHGFFGYAAVGATNVGSITVYRDEDLSTNHHSPADRDAVKNIDWKLEKGEMFGQFNLGSTIVLIFEAPADFRFGFEQGNEVKMGLSLGSVPPRSKWFGLF